MTRRSRRLGAGRGRPDSPGQSVHWPDDRDDSVREAAGHRAAVAGIQERAVRRGLSRRPVAAATAIGVDETSFQRRHEYVTVVNDLTTSEPTGAVRGGRPRRCGPGRLLRRAGRSGLRAGPEGRDVHVAGLHPVGARAHGGADRVRQVPRGAAPGGGGRQGSTVGEPSPADNRATTGR